MGLRSDSSGSYSKACPEYPQARLQQIQGKQGRQEPPGLLNQDEFGGF